MPSLRTFISSSRVMRFPLIAWIRTKSANCFLSRRASGMRRLPPSWSSTDMMSYSDSQFAQNHYEDRTGSDEIRVANQRSLANYRKPPGLAALVDAGDYELRPGIASETRRGGRPGFNAEPAGILARAAAPPRSPRPVWPGLAKR